MEFSVSKSDLVRELGLTQGVVEKKTTIPILSFGKLGMITPLLTSSIDGEDRRPPSHFLDLGYYRVLNRLSSG
jgi:hypothetical protein